MRREALETAESRTPAIRAGDTAPRPAACRHVAAAGVAAHANHRERHAHPTESQRTEPSGASFEHGAIASTIMPKQSVGETLLQLLEHADGETLTVLLDTANLRKLLHHAGWADDRIRRELAGGTGPGELLLQLFKGGATAASLVAALSPEDVERVKRESAERRAATGAAPTNGGVAAAPTGRRVAPGGVWLAATFAPGLAPALIGMLSLDAGLRMLLLGPVPVLAAIGALGALGGALTTKRPVSRVVGTLSGALVAMGAFLGVFLYVWVGPGAGRSSLMKLEIVLAALVGALPGLAAFLLLQRAPPQSESPSS